MKKLLCFLMVAGIVMDVNANPENIGLHWQTFQYMDFKVSIQSPYPLIKDAKRAKNGILWVTAADQSRGIKITLEGNYEDKTDLKDLPPIFFKILKLGARNIQNTDFNLKESTESTTCSGFPAIVMQANTIANQKVLRTKILVVRRGPEILFVQILYPENEANEKTVDRVIHSVQLIN